MGVRFRPAGTRLYHLRRARVLNLGDHEGFRRHGDDDRGRLTESSGGGHAGETGVAAAGAVEVRQVRGWVGEEGAADQVAHAAGLEGGGRLEVFEFEEDAAGVKIDQLLIETKKCKGGKKLVGGDLVLVPS